MELLVSVGILATALVMVVGVFLTVTRASQKSLDLTAGGLAVTAGGKPAVTHYRVRRRFRAHALLRVKLETGRTHQIRVHMAHIRFPLLGDPVYGAVDFQYGAV